MARRLLFHEVWSRNRLAKLKTQGCGCLGRVCGYGAITDCPEKESSMTPAVAPRKIRPLLPGLRLHQSDGCRVG